MAVKAVGLKKLLAVTVVAVILAFPGAVFAHGGGHHNHHHGRGIHRDFPGHGTSGKYWEQCCSVPEFSANAAASAVALLIGGAFIIADRKRKQAV